MRFVRSLRGRPAIAFAVLGIGVFCLAFAPLVRFYVLPRVELLPMDQVSTSVSSGPGTYFDANTLSVKGPVTMTLTTRVVGDVAAGEATGYAVWNMSSRVDTPDTLPLNDPRAAYSFATQRLVLDRHTGVLVNCCGVSPKFDVDVDHLPYPFVYLNFPFGTTKSTYDFWNPQIGNAFPLHFAGTTTLRGLELYRFTGTVPPTKIGSADVPGMLVGLPNAAGPVHVDTVYRDDGIEMLVEPMTGAPIRTTVHPTTTFRLQGASEDRLTVLATAFTTTPASEQALLTTTIEGARKLRLIQDTVPTVLLWGGTVLTLVGVGLSIDSARRSKAAAKAAVTEVVAA